MNQYYSTCPAGLEKLVSRLSAPAIKGFSLIRVMPGAILYSAAPGRVPNCGGFHNTYEVLSLIPRSRHLTFAAERFAADADLMRQADQAITRRRARTYRIMFVENDRFAQVKSELRAQMERPIRHAKVSRENPEVELTVLQRPEGSAYLLLRLTHGENTRHQLESGELPAQVAWCLTALARPRHGGVFLDPFCGSGAVGLARLRFPAPRSLMCFDLDGEKVHAARRRLPEYATCERQDAFTLDERLDAGSVTEIATDPVDALGERRPTQYYLDMLRQLAWVLAPGGTLALLVGDDAHVESALSLLPELHCREKWMFTAGSRRLFLYQCMRRGSAKKS